MSGAASYHSSMSAHWHSHRPTVPHMRQLVEKELCLLIAASVHDNKHGIVAQCTVRENPMSMLIVLEVNTVKRFISIFHL